MWQTERHVRCVQIVGVRVRCKAIFVSILNHCAETLHFSRFTCIINRIMKVTKQCYAVWFVVTMLKFYWFTHIFFHNGIKKQNVIILTSSFDYRYISTNIRWGVVVSLRRKTDIGGCWGKKKTYKKYIYTWHLKLFVRLIS